MGKAWNQQGISKYKIQHWLLSSVKQVLYMQANRCNMIPIALRSYLRNISMIDKTK